MRTSVIKISIDGTAARLEFEGTTATAEGAATAGRDLLIRMTDHRAWIRIQPDGRYSHRVYQRSEAAMSYGVCKMVPALTP